MTVSQDDQAIAGYLTHLEASRGRRPRTIEAYRMALGRLATFMEGRSLLEASPVELEAFAGIWLHKQGVVARSRKPYVSAVRGFFAWARQRGLVKDNPALDLEHPKTGKPLPDALSLASAEKLMWAPDLNSFVGVRDAAILALLMGCGLRVSGLVGLNESGVRNSEIDGKVRLVLHVTEKGEKERMLPVPRDAEMLLRVYMDHDELKAVDRDIVDAKGRPDKILFVNTRNNRVPEDKWRGEAVRLSRHSVWLRIQRYGLQKGIAAHELHPHAFRHLFGVELAEDEVDVLTRQELMGHSDPKSTAIYTAMSMRLKTAVLDKSGPLGKIKTPVSEVLRRL